MRSFIFGLFFLIASVYVHGDIGGQIVEKDKNGERVGNPDDLAEIVRPCPTFDSNCIRKFFSTHAHCTKSFGPAPDPFNRAQANYYVPRVNVSTTDLNQNVTGLNGRIEEFYINKETDNLVIAVEFRNLTLRSDNVNAIFHRRAREAVVTGGFTVVKMYQSVIVTAVIPKIDDLQIQRAECTAFANDQVLMISPEAAESSDPQVQNSIAQVPPNNQIIAQELLLTDSFFFIVTFIQYNICDFGLYNKIG